MKKLFWIWTIADGEVFERMDLKLSDILFKKAGTEDETQRLNWSLPEWRMADCISKLATLPYGLLNFISSFRLHPERTYYESTKSDLRRVEKFGEGYLDQIMFWDAKYP